MLKLDSSFSDHKSMTLPSSLFTQLSDWRLYLNWLAVLFIAMFIILAPSYAVSAIYEKYAVQRVAQLALLVVCGVFILMLCLDRISTAANAYVLNADHSNGDSLTCDGQNISIYKTTYRTDALNTTNLLLITIAFCGFVSSILSQFIEYAFLEYAYSILLFGLAYVISYAIQTKSSKQWLPFLAAIALCSLSLYFFQTLTYFMAFIVNGKYYSTALLTDLGFENRRFAAAYQVLLLPMLFWLSQTKVGWIQRYQFVVFTLSGFCLMLCAVTQSRGTILFIIGATIMVSLINSQALKNWIRFLIASSLVGLVLGLLMFWLPPRFGWILEVVGHRGDIESLISLSWRDEVWLIAFSHIFSSPIWGIGPMHFASYSNHGYGAHPHNIYLQIWAEWGSIAFILLLVVLYTSLRKFIINTKNLFTNLALNVAPNSQLQNLYALSVSLSAAYGGILLFGLVDGLFVYPVTQVVIAVLIGLGIGITKVTSTDAHINADTVSRQSRLSKSQTYWANQLQLLFVMVLTFFSIVTIIKIVPIQIPDTQLLEQDYLEKYQKKSLTPRFWRQGWFTYDHEPSKTKPAEAK